MCCYVLAVISRAGVLAPQGSSGPFLCYIVFWPKQRRER